MSKKPPPEEMRIEYMDLEALRGHPRNPKLHDVELIDASMRRWGYVAPPLIDERTGLLAAGHGRLETLAKRREAKQSAPDRIKVGPKGEWLVPVIRGISFKDDHELVAYLVADNRATEAGGWDDDKLSAALQEAAASGGLVGTGFDIEEASALATQAADIEVEEVDFSDVQDRFWMSVRGPLPKQMEALEALREHLESIPGLEVDVGTTEGGT